MNTIDRREDIVRRLTISAEPISASSLAAAYGENFQHSEGLYPLRWRPQRVYRRLHPQC